MEKRHSAERKPAEGNPVRGGERLNKYLAASGCCSRREADQWIQAGEVRVNGVTAGLGLRVSPGDRIEIKGVPLGTEPRPGKVYLALNKPRGIVCTTDRREAGNIVDYMKLPYRIFPIGRLDKDSSGLILLTNDGEIVNRILRARYGHEKEYHVELDRDFPDRFLQDMAKGVPSLGTVTKPCRCKRLGKARFTIVLTQGLNRQIRRMCEALGYRVRNLERVRIMHITLGSQAPGTWRPLSPKELAELERLLAAAEARAAAKTPERRRRTRIVVSPAAPQADTAGPSGSSREIWIPVSIALIRSEDGRLWIGRRSRGQHCAELLEFPGGKIEAGENPEAACRREIQEELGIQLTELRALTCVRYRYPDRNVELHVFTAKPAGACAVPAGSADGGEAGEEHFFLARPEELKAEAFCGASQNLVRSIQAGSLWKFPGQRAAAQSEGPQNGRDRKGEEEA